MGIEWYTAGKPSIVGLCVGTMSGLAPVTPSAGFIQPGNALFLGALAAPVCWLCIKYAKKSGRCVKEEALNVWGCHGVGGFLGTVMLGLLADGRQCADPVVAGTGCVNPGTVTRSGLQFMVQFAAASVAALYSFAISYGVLKGVAATGITIVPSQEEQIALESDHDDVGYTLVGDNLPTSTKQGQELADYNTAASM